MNKVFNMEVTLPAMVLGQRCLMCRHWREDDRCDITSGLAQPGDLACGNFETREKTNE